MAHRYIPGRARETGRVFVIAMAKKRETRFSCYQNHITTNGQPGVGLTHKRSMNTLLVNLWAFGSVFHTTHRRTHTQTQASASAFTAAGNAAARGTL